MTTVAAYAVPAAKAPLERTTIERRAVREFDVLIDIKFAGICHSDIHQAREGWGEAIFPMVPGHEIAGIVSEVGPGVTRFQVGDRVGVLRDARFGLRPAGRRQVVVLAIVKALALELVPVREAQPGPQCREGAEIVMRGKALELAHQGNYVAPSICAVRDLSLEAAKKSIYQQTELFAPNVAIMTGLSVSRISAIASPAVRTSRIGMSSESVSPDLSS